MDRHPDLPQQIAMHNVDLGGKDAAFPPGEDFWTQVEMITAAGDFAPVLDQMLENHPVPRIWLLLHEIGREALSATAALGFARVLSERDQVVMLLDCDDWACSLTQWAGRRECEGWIDMVRTRNSVLTAGQELPFAGERKCYLIGVGSYTPTDVTVEEIEALLGRLRSQADDILLVAPADDVGRMWAGYANIRLLCWDPALGGQSGLQRLVSSFAEAGTPLTGLVGLGQPAAADGPAAETPPSSDSESPVLDEEAFAEPETEVVYFDDEQAAGNRKTSGVFWGAAGVFLVLITVVFLYYWQFMRTPGPTGGEPTVAMAPAASVTDAPPAGFQAPTDQSTQADLTETAEPAEETPVAGPESLASSLREVAAAPATAAEDKPVASDAAVEQLAGSAAEAATFDMAPYVLPVGADGWALHVYSFADSTQARQQIEELAGKGFRAEQQTVQIPEKGRYYRIYLGSFPTRSAANQAKAALLAELREDWAQAARF